MMFFGCKDVFAFHNFLLSLIVITYCESQTLTTEEEEIILKLRPLKNSPSNGCKEFCKNIICETIKECENGTVLKESYCNCCETCVKLLDIGQPCKKLIKGSLAQIGQSRCKSGTKCENGKCELDRSVKGCLLQREIRSQLKGKGKYAKDMWIPQCDKDGKYEGKQRKIRRSICVDDSGKRIFGNADESLDNNCACSRHMEKKKQENIAYNIKAQEHCSSSGNFDALQCISNLCYCADKKTGEVKSQLVRLDFLENLPCYDSKNHRRSYLKNCEVELQRSRKLSYEFLQKGVKLLGIDRIKCDPDGSYSPTQCLSDRCVCTDEEGIGIGSYYKEKREVVKLSMTCNCARGEISTVLASPFTCLDYGSYNQFTCFDDDCVCVDEDGDSISIELKQSEVDVKLTCNELINNLDKETGEDDGGDDIVIDDDYIYDY